MNTQQCPVCASTIPTDVTLCPVCGATIEPATDAQPDHQHAHVLPVGTQLKNGAYSIGRVLGRGGFGVTYLGADLRRRNAIAIKEFFPAGATRQGRTAIPPDTLSRTDFLAAIEGFLDEGQVLTRFHHPNIVDVYEVFQENETAYLAMEYLRGNTLSGRLEEHGGPLPEREILAIARLLVDALEVIHAAGLLHRDIKPDNVILAEGGDVLRPVLIDFGATREFVSGKTMRQSVLLTPGYAPLEQYAQQARRGPFTDIYALAATFYHLATGQQPPPATDRAAGIDLKPPRQLNPTLTPTFERALLHALEIPIDKRPSTVREFYQELSGASALLPTGPDIQPDVPEPTVPRSSGLERARQIARELNESAIASAQIERDRLVCPVCRDATLVDPSEIAGPLRCAVCRVADLHARVPREAREYCPSCRTGRLGIVRLEDLQRDAVMHCPACRVGAVVRYVRPKLLVVPDIWARCTNCQAEFDFHTGQDELKLEKLPNGPGFLDPALLGRTLPRQEWERLSGRTETMYRCPVCEAEFDRHVNEGPAGTLEWIAVGGDPERVPPEYRQRHRPPVEFIKLANRVPLEVGTHNCPHCRAEYDEIQPGRYVLRDAARDPYNVLARHRDEPHPAGFWHALALGSRAPREADLICPNCTAELQQQADERYRLAAFDPTFDPYQAGTRFSRSGQPYSRSDWQRIAAGALPALEERRLRDEADREIWRTILTGTLSVLSPDRPYPDLSDAASMPSIWSVWQAVLTGDLGRFDPNRPNPYAVDQGEIVILALPVTAYQESYGNFYAVDRGMIWVTTRKLLFDGQQVTQAIPLADIDEWLTTRWSTGFAGEAEEIVIMRIRGEREKVIYGFRQGDQIIDVALEGLTMPLRVDVNRFIELCKAVRQTGSRSRRAG